jgi:pilus assembly protein CpaE
VGDAIARGISEQPDVRVESFPTVRASLAAIAAGEPTVVLVGPTEPPDDGIALAARTASDEDAAAVVLVAGDIDTSLLRAAIKAGVRDVLVADDGVDAAVAAVLAADRAVRRRREASAPQSASVPEEPPPLGKVVTVFSTKGGVGKSVLSTNLAAALAHDLGKRTILLDLDLEFGDVSVMLQIPPDRTIFDAAQAFERLDAEMMDGFLTGHESGLRALLAPVRPEEAESVTTGRIAQIIAILRTLADFVVVDTPASLSDVVLTALELSDVVLAVATLDVPSVKNTRVSLQKLHQLGFDGTTVRLVLNRADSKVWLEPHEIEKAIADKIVARIPSDRLVPRSVNKGIPVVMDAPRSAVARSILALAREVAAS